MSMKSVSTGQIVQILLIFGLHFLYHHYVTPQENVQPNLSRFLFQNLAEKCYPEDLNWEIYRDFREAVRAQPRNVTLINELHNAYANGQICFPKFTCSPAGICECREGYSFEEDGFTLHCFVYIDYPCDPDNIYFRCISNASCLSTPNPNALELPTPMGEVLGTKGLGPQNYTCICDPGKLCNQVTVQSVLDEISKIKTEKSCGNHLLISLPTTVTILLSLYSY